jgi:hypothetical protein
VMVLAVDDGDINVGFAKGLGGFQAAEATADDDNFGAGQTVLRVIF